jgi:hypothetical protein
LRPAAAKTIFSPVTTSTWTHRIENTEPQAEDDDGVFSIVAVSPVRSGRGSSTCAAAR